ncbi:hypothetical protein ABLN72_09180, partial [Mycobacterium tuberculosis]
TSFGYQLVVLTYKHPNTSTVFAFYHETLSRFSCAASVDIGSVTVAGDARLPASGMLFVGTPDGQIVAPGPLPSNQAAKATVNLTKPIANGLTYNFTFKFEKAGQGSVMVPISAGLATPHE